ncbi:MAG: hypothetical protein ABT16_00850 [Rhodanobacter sp. SCN 65-17]|nr:MAG: hypothetical protein ABT16_00850 [Rhodanobacter sp. SCN 65-17]
MASKTIQDLFVHELSDIYSAEKQLTKALPRLARAASDEELKKAFEAHAEETQRQVERIDAVAQAMDIRVKRLKSGPMESLIEEGRDVIESIPQGPLRDVALVAGAQKVEHYEIAAYGTLCALAKELGQDKAASLLEETLQEEKQTDQKLTVLAEQGSNKRAKGQSTQAEQ